VNAQTPSVPPTKTSPSPLPPLLSSALSTTIDHIHNHLSLSDTASSSLLNHCISLYYLLPHCISCFASGPSFKLQTLLLIPYPQPKTTPPIFFQLLPTTINMSVLSTLATSEMNSAQVPTKRLIDLDGNKRALYKKLVVFGLPGSGVEGMFALNSLHRCIF
jgi:hypothetical protein